MREFPADSVGLVRPLDFSVRLGPEGFAVSGGVLPELVIRYEMYGNLSPRKDNVILVCAPLTADAHAAGYHTDSDSVPGWWDPLIGPGKAMDTTRFCVICSNNLGGCKGTTGPSSLDPRTGKPYGSTFPHISIGDMVRVQHALVTGLGISKLYAVIGGSMGGFMAMKWAMDFPDMVERCVIIASTTKLSAQALGFESVGRRMIVNDPEFYGGDYYDRPSSQQQFNGKGPIHGLSHARQLAHITYLSAVALEKKHARRRQRPADPARFQTGFAVESYLEHQGEKFLQRFDANSYLHITWAMDQFDLEAEYGSLSEAFGRVRAEVLNINLSSDWLFPPPESRVISMELLNQRKVISSVELDTPYGHDGFLVREMPDLAGVISRFLREEDGTRRAELARSALREREDYRWLETMIEPGARVLDLGCGDGSFIDALWHAHKICGVGMERDFQSINACLERRVPVLQWDLDQGLTGVADQSFDFVILNRTLQEVRQPATLLREILRVGRKAFINFPNFGYWKVRSSLLLRGKMPKSEYLPHEWYDTPNIHLFTLRDFTDLCAREGIRIEKIHVFGGDAVGRWLCRLGLPNLGAEQVIALVSKER